MAMWKNIFLSCALTASFIFLLMIVGVHFVPSHTFLKYVGYDDGFVMKDPQKITDPQLLQQIGELVRDGTLLSVDDFWSFQASFYQTIIAVLVAINALIAAFSFLVIRSASFDKAVDESLDASKKQMEAYLKTKEFYDQVKSEVSQGMQQTKSDYDDMVTKFDEHLETFDHLRSQLDQLQEQNQILVSKLAQLDENENLNNNDSLEI